MPTTMDLLREALAKKPQAEWCRDLNVTPSALSKAKRQGHISSRFAAHMAMETGKDPIYWSVVALAEAEPDGPLKKALVKRLAKLPSHSLFNARFDVFAQHGKRSIRRCFRREKARDR